MRSAFSARKAPQMDSGPAVSPACDGQTQTVLRRVFVHFAELLGRGPALISPESDPDNISVLEANGFFHDALRFFNSEVANRVEDPI